MGRTRVSTQQGVAGPSGRAGRRKHTHHVLSHQNRAIYSRPRTGPVDPILANALRSARWFLARAWGAGGRTGREALAGTTRVAGTSDGQTHPEARVQNPGEGRRNASAFDKQHDLEKKVEQVSNENNSEVGLPWDNAHLARP